MKTRQKGKEQKHGELRGFEEFAIYTHSVPVNNNSLLMPGTVLDRNFMFIPHSVWGLL